MFKLLSKLLFKKPVSEQKHSTRAASKSRIESRPLSEKLLKNRVATNVTTDMGATFLKAGLKPAVKKSITVSPASKKFIAIDVETANPDMASICSIGAATFENGQLASEWYSLINPQDYFDDMNISIHGITEQVVRNSPSFKQVKDQIVPLLTNSVVVTHTHFDRVAIHQASAKAGISVPACTWLDSARVARRSWADCSQKGYGLAKLCKKIDFEFEHHNALEDAKAAGHILLAAMAETGLDLNAMLKRVQQPVNSSFAAPVTRDGNLDGSLSGEVVVFTGALEMLRREAADLAASVGCDVGLSVTRKTTLLVVGDVDVQKLAGHKKSLKHRKAEDLLSKGQPIRIIRETDFQELIKEALNS